MVSRAVSTCLTKTKKSGCGASLVRCVRFVRLRFRVYFVNVISIVLTFVGPRPSSPGRGGNCCVPISMAFTLTSGKNRRLHISTTSTARLIAIPLALTFISGALPWKRVMHART